MSVDAVLLVILAVMLYARIAAGRPVPLAAFGVVVGTWLLLLVAGVGAHMFGALTRLNGYDPSGYYTSPIMELYSVCAAIAQSLLKAFVLVGAMVAAALTPIPETQSQE